MRPRVHLSPPLLSPATPPKEVFEVCGCWLLCCAVLHPGSVSDQAASLGAGACKALVINVWDCLAFVCVAGCGTQEPIASRYCCDPPVVAPHLCSSLSHPSPSPSVRPVVCQGHTQRACRAAVLAHVAVVFSFSSHHASSFHMGGVLCVPSASGACVACTHMCLRSAGAAGLQPNKLFAWV